VFTTTGRTAISGFGRLKDRLDAAFGPDAEDWRIHDLRRTVATNMAMLRVQPQVIEAVLNHKSGIVSGVAAIYNRHAYQDEKREALEAWANRVREIVTAASKPRQAEETIAGPVRQLPALEDYRS
jgi:integrase